LERCRNLKKWESSKKMKELIVELCTYEPLSINEIADILHRKPHSIRYLYVSSLIEDGRLFFTIPEMIKHPNQKYTAFKNN
jgi:ATP-dependent DNA helicase RecG